MIGFCKMWCLPQTVGCVNSAFVFLSGNSDMKKFIRRCLVALGVVAASSSVFAEGSTVTIDTANVQALQTAMTSWVTTVLPYALSIAGAFVAFYMLRLGLRVFKSIASGSK